MHFDPKPVQPKADRMWHIAVCDDQVELTAGKRLGGRLDIPFAGIRNKDHPSRHAAHLATPHLSNVRMATDERFDPVPWPPVAPTA